VVLNDADIYDYASFLGIFNNVYEVNREGRYITADIALEGSDKFVVGVWYGKELVDIAVIGKSKGNEVINTIVAMAKKHKVPNHNIAYDNDGVGGFVSGFIEGAKPFVNNGSTLPNPDTNEPENYKNLKTQCYYRSGASVAKGEYKISEYVANQMYDDSMTVRQRFVHERKAIKKGKKDDDGKLCLIKKEEMKVKLNGDSPDMMDMFMMREWFELAPVFIPGAY
jgi:hypothetical protein